MVSVLELLSEQSAMPMGVCPYFIGALGIGAFHDRQPAAVGECGDEVTGSPKTIQAGSRMVVVVGR